MNNIITPMNDPRLEKILLYWPAWCDQEPRLIRQLKGGLTNDNYLLQTPHRQYVLRINTAISHALDLNRNTEARALSSAAEAGIGAPLVFCDPDKKYLVTEYITGRQWQAEDFRVEGGTVRLARLLNVIHGLEPIANVLDVREKAAHYWLAINQRSELAQQLRALEPEVQFHITCAKEKTLSLCFCHNDLLAENLIMGDNSCLYAIDWEYAAMADPYFELAVIVEGHGLNNSQCKALLAAYFKGESSEGDSHRGDYSANNNHSDMEQRLFHSRVVYCYLVLLWYAVKSSNHRLMGIDKQCKKRLLYLKSLLSQSF